MAFPKLMKGCDFSELFLKLPHWQSIIDLWQSITQLFNEESYLFSLNFKNSVTGNRLHKGSNRLQLLKFKFKLSEKACKINFGF